MGNTWTGYSRDELLETEMTIFTCTGDVPRDVITVRDVRLSDADEDFMHEVYIAGAAPNLPTLLMVHGFMAGNAYWHKMIAPLRQKFNIVCVDTYGQGASGRPELEENTLTNYDDTIDYIVGKLSRFVEVNDHLPESFYIVGHSMGSIVSSHFTFKNPNKVLGLVLLSPVGIEEDPSLAAAQGRIENYAVQWANNSYPKSSFAPQDLYRIMGYRMSYKSIRGDMHGRFNSESLWVNETEIDAFTKYSV